MNIKRLIATMILSILTTISFAAPFIQAGNILEGKKAVLDPEKGIISYYADGKSGIIIFSCDLQGDGEPKAYLRPGKNFDNPHNPPLVSLVKGVNGLFSWTLTDEKADTGNIKVTHVSGSNVTIQCVGKKYD